VTDRILVTGAAGLVGRHVVEQLHASDADVIAVAHRWEDGTALRAQLPEGPIDRCIHAGWHFTREDAAVNLLNFRSSVLLLAEVRSRGCRHFLGIGSGAEYAPQDRPCTETDPLVPGDSYALAKSAFLAVLESGLASGCTTAWARIFNAIGPGERPDRLFTSTVRGALDGTPVLLSSGEQQMDAAAVEDVARGLIAISDAALEGPWNVSTGQPYRVRELAEALAARAGDTSVLRFGAIAAREGDRRVYSGSPARLTAATGWKPEIDVEELVDRMVRAGRASSSAG
jgi:nucleoside-diphosphate-sugar epimerase